MPGLRHPGRLWIQPSPTWAEDASTPAYAHSTTTSVTTASFTPPGSAVLVACISGNVASSGAGSSLTVASTPSLTWTLRAYNTSTSSNGLTAVYTATTPAGAVTGPPLNQGPLPNRPALIVSNAGWRSAGHSR